MSTDDSQFTSASEMSLNSLMQMRELMYTKYTKIMFFKFESRLSPAVQRIMKIDQPIIWETIETLETLSGFSTVMGYFRPNIGDKLPDMNGNIVEIDEVTIKHFRSIIRFFIPTTLLEHGSEEELYDFLSNLQYISTLVNADELIELLKDPHTFKLYTDQADIPEKATISEALSGIIEAITKPAELYGFNTKNMTAEQINQLSLLMRINNIQSTKQ